MNPLTSNFLFLVQIKDQLEILAQGLNEGVKVRAEKYFILKILKIVSYISFDAVFTYLNRSIARFNYTSLSTKH